MARPVHRRLWDQLAHPGPLRQPNGCRSTTTAPRVIFRPGRGKADMANAQTTFDGFNKNINALINALEDLQTYKQMFEADGTLADVVVTYANQRGWNITSQDINNAVSAITQMLFTFNSGDPTQASYLYK